MRDIGPRAILPGKRGPALLLAVLLIAGFLPSVEAAKDYQVSAGAGYGGSIQPSGLVSVAPGDTPLFSITPAQGFRISGVWVNGAPVGAVPVYTFPPVYDDYMIYARFARITGSLQVDSDPAGARVYLDSEYSGNVPDQGGLIIGDVPAGDHTLRFALAGYRTVQINARVEEGEQTIVPLVALVLAETTPTTSPTSTATTIPTTVPTTAPTIIPTTAPTTVVTTIPTTEVTTMATTIPTTATTIPTTAPSTIPTTGLTTIPTTLPVTTATTVPTTVLTTATTAPTTSATTVPTTGPTTIATTVPTSAATTLPTTAPTTAATTIPITDHATLPTTAPGTTVPTPTPEPSPAPGGTGSLFVVSDPTALVVIQRAEKGRTNEVIEGVPAGSQTVVLSREGYVPHTMLVKIEAGRVTVTPKVFLEQAKDLAGTPTPTITPTPGGSDSRYPANGALFIYSVPFGCSLSIDDIPVGMTPKLITSVPPGTHTVSIELPGYGDAYRTVTVHPRDISMVLVMMTPDIRSIESAFS